MGNWLPENILVIIIVTIVATVVGKVTGFILRVVLIALLVLIIYYIYVNHGTNIIMDIVPAPNKLIFA